MLKTLLSLGLTTTDAEIYLFLLEEDQKERKTIAQTLKILKRELNESLNQLQTMGIIIASPRQPQLFKALPFEQALDLLLQMKKEQVRNLQESRKLLLSSWRNLIKRDNSA